MNTKLIIATVAALSLATTAFAAEGNGDPFPFRAPTVTSPATQYVARDTGSQQYPTPNPAFSSSFNGAPILPVNGSNGPVQTANSLPRGFENGTVAFVQAQSIDRWYAQQAEHRFAQSAQRRPNG